MLERITLYRDNLSKAERKVADVILANPQTAIHSSIAILAKQAEVSEPTVNRFCHRLNTKGFPDFKLQLAQTLAQGTPYVNRNVEPHDSVESYSHKIFDSAIISLEKAKRLLDLDAISNAVKLLARAHKISFFGYGASAAVAQDAMNKFFRFNIPVFYSDDIVMQRMGSINSVPDDVIVLISHSGRTKSLVELATLAKIHGAKVIAITSANTPLANVADLALTLEVQEDTDIYMPMMSRIVQLTLIDILATGFILQQGSEFRENLRRTKTALVDSRFDKHDS